MTNDAIDAHWLAFIIAQGWSVDPLSDEAADAYERLEAAGKIVRERGPHGTTWRPLCQHATGA